MEMSPGTLETVGGNELFVAVTVDASFTTEQVVVGRIDEMQILSAVRTAPMVGCLSPSQICDDCALLCARKMDMEMSPDSLEDFLTKAVRVSPAPTSSLPFSICPSRPSAFFCGGEICFFSRITITGGIVDVFDTLTSDLMFSSPVPALVGEVVHRYRL
jgi:hypothetical protein